MKYYLLLLLLAMHTGVFCQVMGTTDEGKRVKLNSNGTWEYVAASVTDTSTAKAEAFSKSANEWSFQG